MPQEPLTSLQNPLVKHLVKLRTQSRYRSQHQQIVVSSRKLIAELQDIVKPVELLGEGGRPVSEGVLKKTTGHPSPEGTVATFPMPKPQELSGKAPLLVCDRIADPGNLGTLMRTAWALGWQGIFLLPNCADPFHEKALSASRGALFHTPWQTGTWEMLETLVSACNLTPYVADLKGKCLSTLSPTKKCLLVLSNEATGASEKATHFGEKISIPMAPGAESLNVAVAGAIMMYHLYES